MTTSLSIAQAREQLTRLPERFAAEEDLEAITITRHGRPVLAVLPWELYESLMETLEIMSDKETMASFRLGVEQAKRGEGRDWEEVKADLGL